MCLKNILGVHNVSVKLSSFDINIVANMLIQML